MEAQYETALIKLSNAEVQIEDLKLQLDDALGAEEMLVQLTERNLMLGEVRAISLPSPFGRTANGGGRKLKK
jgi:hypothetical protein